MGRPALNGERVKSLKGTLVREAEGEGQNKRKESSKTAVEMLASWKDESEKRTGEPGLAREGANRGAI